MAKHALKTGSPQDGGIGTSRYVDKKVGSPSSTTQQPSLAGDGKNLGPGTANSRVISTKPGGSTGVKGSAQPKESAPVYDPQTASVLGKNVYRSTKPAKK